MIVIIGPAHPYRGGIADTHESLANALIDLGYDVKVFTFSRLYPNRVFPGKTQFSSKQKPEGIDIERSIDHEASRCFFEAIGGFTFSIQTP